jgi:hypothetical protein
MKRAQLILQRTVVEIMAPALAHAGLCDLAARARALRTPMELVEIARRLHDSNCSAQKESLSSAFEHAADAVAQWRSGLPTEIVFCAFSAMREIASLDHERHAETVYREASAILDAALAIGNKAPESDTGVVTQRLDAAKHAPDLARREHDPIAV